MNASYSGTILANWDLDAGTLGLNPAGTFLMAGSTGNWQPLPGGASGNAPANYGGKVTALFLTANAALRDVVVSTFTIDPLPLSGTGSYSFPSTQAFTVLMGEADYNAGFLGSGRADISGLFGDNQSPVPGMFEDLGSGSYRLTMPVNFAIGTTVAGLPTALHVNGQIVAYAVLPVINLSDGTGASFDYATSAIGGGGPVAIADPAATITRTPSANLTSLTITLTNHPDDPAEFLNYDPNVLATYGLSTDGYDPTTGQLVITGSADPSVYQAVLQTITYEDDSPTPTTDDRQIQFVASDGTNSSIVRTTTVSVSAPAPPPGGGALLWVGLPQLPRNRAVPESATVVSGATASTPLLPSTSLGLHAAAEDLTRILTALPHAHQGDAAGELSLELENGFVPPRFE